MKLSKLVFAGLFIFTANTALAEGGSERAQEYLAQFQLRQAQIHGAEQTAPSIEATAQAEHDESIQSGNKSEG